MWRQALLEVDELKDGLGRGLDPGSRELVACLRLLGLKTIMSCEGHAERETEGPYVMFRSLEAKPLEAEYWKLVAEGKRKSDEAKQLRKTAYELNLRERRKLTPLLNEFYENRATSYDNRIIISTFDLGGSRLRCQSAEEYRLAGKSDREAFLRAHQQEFGDFTAFLMTHLKLPSSAP